MCFVKLSSGAGDALLCLFCALVLDRLRFSAVVFGWQKRELFVIVAFHGEMSAVFGGGGSLPGCMKENSRYEKMREDQFHNCRLKMQSWPRNVSECIGTYLDVLALLFIASRMYLNVSECIWMYWLYFS